MATRSEEQRLERRIAELYGNDSQFAAARPDQAMSAAIDRPGLRLPQIIHTVMTGYADRPALGDRAVELLSDPATGRTSAELMTRFATVSYGELWDRVSATARALAAGPSPGVQPGDRVGIIGFTSVDYTVIDLALVLLDALVVPMHTGTPLTALRPIVTETDPVAIATSVEDADDAVELMLTGHAGTRLVMFDYRPEVDDHRDALHAVRARFAAEGRAVVVETLDDLIRQGNAVPARPDQLAFPAANTDPLRLLLYTSGSTGSPKGAMYPERLVANAWRSSATAAWAQRGEHPSITLNFMPMSHMMGRSSLYGTLRAGGTAYFAARSDLSTLLDDLALVRPTQLNFVPRVWDMLLGEFQSEVGRRWSDGVDLRALEAEVMAQQRQHLLGGRFLSAMTGSAPISDETREFVKTLLQLHLVEGYCSTEAGVVLLDGRVRRPPVVDYTLVDVPELGYYSTDRPHPCWMPGTARHWPFWSTPLSAMSPGESDGARWMISRMRFR